MKPHEQFAIIVFEHGGMAANINLMVKKSPNNEAELRYGAFCLL